MNKWYEQVVYDIGNNYISSRVRLSRNRIDYKFPGKLSQAESKDMIDKTQISLSDMSDFVHEDMNMIMLSSLNEQQHNALRSRRLINKSIANKEKPVGIAISESESISVILGGDDHIRIQLLAAGNMLTELWRRADGIDDYINSKFDYAFDEKYGYLTSFPTNVGTGLKANIVMHLPLLSMSKGFKDLVDGMTRVGVTVKGVYGEGRENAGDLYDISNARTLGLSETEYINLVIKAASELNLQESNVRKISIDTHRYGRLDEIWKSYGVLKYAKKLTLKDAMMFLSHIMTGLSDGLVETESDCSIYAMMLMIQPAAIIENADKPLNQEEMDILRADKIRKILPEIKEV